MNIESLDFDKGNGLLPAVIQDVTTKQVLMLGYMNKEAVQQTLKKGKVTFYSRSKERLWMKGEQSGNVLDVEHIEADCDQDALLIEARPHGPTCHTGNISCFHDKTFTPAEQSGYRFLAELEQLLYQRKQQLPEGSYTASMFQKGDNKVAQKVGEEAVETVIAALNEEQSDFRYESADLLFHLMMLLVQKDMRFSEIVDELEQRHS
ncbi:MAG: bifunctional phosphoribosyl-AMP cyclohydrolase/phosphoribosyl-ATP diphosphatase HisIE [Bacteroidota bacterium]